MSSVLIKYKGTDIAELSETTVKTLDTSGTYCEEDIEIAYVSNSKTYDLNIANASGWVLLTELDKETISYINDENLVVVLINLSDYVFESYSVALATAANKPIGVATASEYPVYGVFAKQSNTTNVTIESTYYPANKTDTSLSLGNCAFRLSDNKYYIRPSDGFIRSGTYRLTFTW